MEKLKFKELVIDQDAKLCFIGEERIPLTKTEYNLLVFLMSHSNQVCSRDKLLEEVWDWYVTDRAIDTNISRLRKKLGSYGPCIVTRPGFGYCFNDE